MPSKGHKELIKDGSAVSSKESMLCLMTETLIVKENNWVYLFIQNTSHRLKKAFVRGRGTQIFKQKYKMREAEHENNKISWF